MRSDLEGETEMVFQTEDRARVKKQQADLAIQLALQGRWTEAAQLNRAIIESFPTDVDAFNRLGKAMTELGRYGEAREAYMKALEFDALNTIARKNLARLAILGEEAAPRRPVTQKLSPQMFIEETGKTCVTALVRPSMEVVARMTAGNQVLLHRQNCSLVVQNANGEYLGEVEPKLAQRLIKLMDGGNQYVAAISALRESEVRLFVRETFQHPSQMGKLSFPPAVSESFRPYVKGRLLRQDIEETYTEEGAEWESGGEPDATDVTIYDRRSGAGADIEIGEDDEEEEE